MKSMILETLVEAGIITEQRKDILANCSCFSSISALTGCDVTEARLQEKKKRENLLSDEEVKALVAVENILAGMLPVEEKETALPLLLFAFCRIVAYAKNPTEFRKMAMEGVLASYQSRKEKMSMNLQDMVMECVDQNIQEYATEMFFQEEE